MGILSCFSHVNKQVVCIYALEEGINALCVCVCIRLKMCVFVKSVLLSVLQDIWTGDRSSPDEPDSGQRSVAWTAQSQTWLVQGKFTLFYLCLTGLCYGIYLSELVKWWNANGKCFVVSKVTAIIRSLDSCCLSLDCWWLLLMTVHQWVFYSSCAFFYGCLSYFGTLVVDMRCSIFSSKMYFIIFPLKYQDNFN